jgi:hypothetical protein
VNKKLIAVSLALVFAGGLLAFQEKEEIDCINVHVDYGPLNNGTKLQVCLDVNGTMKAIDVVESVGFTLEGTQKYGDAVVCRVNGLPDKSTESCREMPPAKAYWAVLIKEKQAIPIPFGFGSTWGWAQIGINEILLDPGDSIGLVFADNGEVRFP